MPLPCEYLEYFKRIRILDSTIFQIPSSLAAFYPGSGGCGQKAGVKIQLEYDLHSGTFLNLQVEPGKNNDKTFGTTCWRRHKKYEKLGIWHRTWRLFLRDLHEMDEMQMDQVHLDASFVAAKKGGTKVGKTKLGKGSQVFCIVENKKGLPIALLVEDANPHEINFAEKMVEEIRIPQKRGAPISRPKILLADKGYNSQAFRLYLKKKE